MIKQEAWNQARGYRVLKRVLMVPATKIGSGGAEEYQDVVLESASVPGGMYWEPRPRLLKGNLD